MPSPKGLDSQVVRREEKLSRMMDFLRISLPKARSECDDTRITINMIARSCDSPVVHATVAGVLEADDASTEIRIILAERPRAISEELAALGPEIRYMPTTRLLDVHEQLVIGETAAWVGDSMRRDPVKLDAYERFLTADTEPTAWAALAFDRLWAIARPAEASAFKVVLDNSVAPTTSAANTQMLIPGGRSDLTGG